MFRRYTGGIFASFSPSIGILGTVSFVGNQATFYGGAISLTDPAEFYFIGTRFELNTASSGGAVSVTPTQATAGGFQDCQFEGNVASYGGALFLSTDDTSVPEKPRFIKDSAFLHNTAGESPLTHCMGWG